ncbi:hypothetical protein [uncultured Gammaproteobacteria bacterium]|nr:hypothetical protein [uncultured Gammaproteobacteria bacterium]
MVQPDLTIYSPPHRWLRKSSAAAKVEPYDSPPHRWLRKTEQ